MNKNYQIRNKLKGPIFSIITPFNKKGEIDYSALRKYIKYLYFKGARNFYVMAYNSRLTLMSEKEIISLNLFCIKQVKKLNKENIIICGEPYHCSTKQSIKYVKYFKKNGADIVSLIFGEKYYSDNQLYEHFKSIHDNSNCFLLLHQQILENGLSSSPNYVLYPIKLLVKIAKLPRFVAMKEDAKSDVYTKEICKKISRKMTIITSGGGKRQWLKVAKHGCDAWLSGWSNLNPKIAIDFYNYYKLKNIKKMNLILNNIEDPFSNIKNKFGWHLTIKTLLELNNNFKRYERSPLKELDKDNMQKIKDAFQKIKKKLLIKKMNDFFRL